MKNKLMMAVACLSAAIGSAQTMETVRVNLPYASRVGKVSLPAGEYSIREMSNSVIEISSAGHNGVSAFAAVNPIVAPNRERVDHTKVILRKDSNGYQIQAIWLEGQEIGFELATAAE